ncbi:MULTISPECIES: Rrf2 family transcriptional regulator [Streptomyces]|uniref:Rrf2 family transcriptional regulator n=1 Tax=Streptomyces olivaceus TaxID=47716 RepID=A0ABS7W0E5_STROV|nr:MULTISPECIES: Rrf2 family transcriptional regulator [Streptomyces]MBZ6089007.1 Rrf2 family transcriptional regulator [Streptomyces olivaceus]MBZ6095619.1 Rrf2 family transcriptional regulator [Streptomyces olivaceus]MBZ6111757.1 Rrf2 family transcriptional regulator [Streptomyces olivaceus]MBZ6119888.1 Rrf2 family transcriptional regulator [Streptomyces olivaceus]MBZ6122935.1 Rrf2 family transcriptional regulator [Streptomyces olivaceus]
MSANSRMSLAVHILTWLAYDRRGTDKEIATSQRIATSVNTNPVVIRRSLGQLKDHKLVTIDHGKSGGWNLARDAASITLLDVYCASSDEPVFGLHASDPDAECYVGYGIQPVLTTIYDQATEALRQSLAQVTVADVLRETLAAYAAGDQPPQQPRASVS